MTIDTLISRASALRTRLLCARNAARDGDTERQIRIMRTCHADAASIVDGTKHHTKESF